MRKLLLVTFCTFTGTVAACSVYMESTRPTPVDLTQFQPGQNRDYVLEQLGAPQSTVVESDGASCDYYKLYTRGYGAGGKIPIALVEGAADVFTLGLAEAITTPAEGATKNDLHPVTFCYKNNSLVRANEAGRPATSAGIPIAAGQQTTSQQPPMPPSQSVALTSTSPQPNTSGQPVAASPSATLTPLPPSASATPAVSPVASSTPGPMGPQH